MWGKGCSWQQPSNVLQDRVFLEMVPEHSSLQHSHHFAWGQLPRVRTSTLSDSWDRLKHRNQPGTGTIYLQSFSKNLTAARAFRWQSLTHFLLFPLKDIIKHLLLNQKRIVLGQTSKGSWCTQGQGNNPSPHCRCSCLRVQVHLKM